jgi:hypothetical protein
MMFRNRGEYEGDLWIDERLLADLVQGLQRRGSDLDKLPRSDPPDALKFGSERLSRLPDQQGPTHG